MAGNQHPKGKIRDLVNYWEFVHDIGYLWKAEICRYSEVPIILLMKNIHWDTSVWKLLIKNVKTSYNQFMTENLEDISRAQNEAEDVKYGH